MDSEITRADAPAAHATSHQPPSWYSLDDARSAVDAALREFLSGIDQEDSDTPPPALALRATVGVGKSHILRMLLAEFAPALLERGSILIFVPTHKLAEEAEEEFRKLGASILSMVLRGRSAVNPATDTPMCQKSDLARRIAELGGSVSTALCQARRPGTGKLVQAACRKGCAWYAQLPAKGEHKIVFLPHAYLRSPLPPSIGGAVALRIVDEKCLGTITWNQTIRMDDWLEACSCRSAPGRRSTTCIHAARSLVHEALLRRQPIMTTLGAAGYTRDRLESFRAEEIKHQPELAITPWMDAAAQFWAVDTFDFAAFFKARARARLWKILHEDWERGTSERLSLAEMAVDAGPLRAVIRLHSCGALPHDRPLLLLDADADPLVTETLAPGAELVTIEVPPNAEVIQVEDRTFSNASLIARPGADERRREILALVRREVAASRQGVLLVATKDVLRRLHQDVEPGRAQLTDDDLMAPLLGAHPRWFGPAMQGVNLYGAFDTAIIIGRLQPRIEVIEEQMRSIFGTTEEPLALMAPDDPKRGWYAELGAAYLMRDGTSRATRIRGYPDPRGAAILAQNREAFTLQAIGRIRAVRAGSPKKILVLSSLALPGFPIDRLVLWQELVTGLTRIELSAKAQRLEAALYPDGSCWPVPGLRLSAAGIREDAPEIFPAPYAAAEWRRGLATPAIQEMIRIIARRRGGRPQFLDLRRPGGGRRIPAVLFDQADPAESVAKRWPGLELTPTNSD